MNVVKRLLRSRFPNVDVWTRAEFSRKARWFWITQTGEGGAILMAALLGFFIGLAIVSQAVYATTMENIEEFATLKAIVGSCVFISGVIVSQAVMCRLGGYILGTLITAPMVKAAIDNVLIAKDVRGARDKQDRENACKYWLSLAWGVS